jgi:hypothetical protein|tara:strand:- start:15913 stop:16056 length:144 start_codon:yes stop_codon:yes gene_type:complete
MPATGEEDTPRADRNLVVLCDGTGNELGGALAEDQRDMRKSASVERG